MKIKILLLLIIIHCFNISQAQYTIKGTITDSKKMSLLSATIVMYLGDSIYGACISDMQGNFNFINVQEGKYSIVVSYLGYLNYDTSFVCKSNLDLGNLLLKVKENHIDEVSIIGETTTKVSVDKIRYKIKSYEKRNAPNALSVLKNVPELTVNTIDKKLIVNGSESSLLLVNNIRRDFQYLQNISPSSIESVEIITNPSTRYLSRDISSIINIQTSEKTIGYSGLVGTSVTPDIITDSWTEYNFRVNNKKISFFTNGYISTLNEDQHIKKYNTKTINDFGSNLKKKETTDYSFYKASYSIIGGCEIDINKSNYLIFDLRLKGWDATRDEVYLGNFYQDNLFQNTFVDSINNKNNELSQKYSAYYQNKGEIGLLAIEFNYNKFKNNTDNYFYETSENDNFLNNLSYLSNKNSIDFQVDYSLQLGDLNLGTGFRCYYQDVNQSILYDNLTDSIEQLTFKELRGYPYFNMKSDIGKNLTYMLGVGYEINNYQIETEKTYKNTFSQILPTAGIHYNINKKNNIKFNYSTRLYRPPVLYLNPSVRYVDSLTISYGNPELTPYYRHRFSLKYTLNKNKIYLSPAIKYDYQPKFINKVGFTNSKGIYETSYDNISVYNCLTPSIYLRYSILKTLQLKASFDYYIMQFKDKTNEIDSRLQSLGFSVSSTYEVNSFSFYLSYQYQPEFLSGEAVVKSANDSWFSFSYNLKDKWFLGFDIRYFELWSETSVIDKKDFFDEYQHTVYDRHFRVLLNVSYNFSNKLKSQNKRKRIKNTDSGDNMDL
jgi:hypothetical protein